LQKQHKQGITKDDILTALNALPWDGRGKIAQHSEGFNIWGINGGYLWGNILGFLLNLTTLEGYGKLALSDPIKQLYTPDWKHLMTETERWYEFDNSEGWLDNTFSKGNKYQVLTKVN
jgi:hypothetical protein